MSTSQPGMDEATVTRFILDSYAGVDTVVTDGNTFFFYNPDPTVEPDHRFPFITLVTSDDYEIVSQLNRPGVYRLNVGVARETYRARFGPQPAFPKDGGVSETGYDYAALDRLMPHPIYAAMSWVGVLNPSAETFEAVKPLMAEAYGMAVSRYERKAGRDGDGNWE